MFNKEQLDRYSRHILLDGVGAQGQEKLMQAKVLVIGAGGLGSPMLMYLAAAGIGTLGIVDFDTVDLSNLQRQIIHSSAHIGQAKTKSAEQMLKSLNPLVKINLHDFKLSSENARVLFSDYDLVIDGSDNFPTRYLVNDACVLEGKPLIYGAISQFEGQLSIFNASVKGVKGPCYRCLFPTPPAVGSVASCAEAGVFGVLPGIIGSMMAAEVIKFILGIGEPLVAVLQHYDALYNDARRVKLTRNQNCEVCGDAPSISELIDYDAFCNLMPS